MNHKKTFLQSFVRKVFCFCVLTICFTTYAKPISWPSDFSQVDFFLHTVDAGNPIYSKFGHTAVRITDRIAMTDMVYNLGTFDDSDPLFAFNFYRGDMFYYMAEYPMQVAYQGYVYENRSTWEDKLNFTDLEKRRFLEKLVWQSQPENRVYRYLYFFDNCSTRIRDFFDYALEGRLSAATQTKMSPDSFRDVVRSHFASISVVTTSLDIIMNSNLDRTMTEWEEMFLPMRLRAHILKTLNAQNVPLVSESQTLVDSKPPQNDQITAYFVLTTLLGLPILFYALMSAFRKHQTHSTVNQKKASVIKIGQKVWAVFSGSIGTLLLCNWIFSGHIDLHHNANLLVFLPLDFLLWHFSRRSELITPRIRIFVLLRLALLASALPLQWTSIISQDLAPVVTTFGLLGFIYWWALLWNPDKSSL